MNKFVEQSNCTIPEVQSPRTGEPAPASTSPHLSGEHSKSTDISDIPVTSIPDSPSQIPVLSK